MTTLTRPRWTTWAATLALLLALAPAANAQMGEPPPASELVKLDAPRVTLKAGGAAEATLTLHIAPSWHINANPAGENMIATAAIVAADRGVTAGTIVYPMPQLVRLGFDSTDLPVWSESATLRVPLAAAANAVNGAHVLRGKLRFQACNDQVCLAPVSVPFEIACDVTGGVAASAGTGSPAPTPAATTTDTTRAATTPDSTASAAPAGGFTTAPPAHPTNAALDNPLARQLASGSWVAYLTIFLIGLALNLTPCVYPMIGVTLSIFGARRAAPPLQVFGMAVLYVLGMALTYSTLGLVAALTGGLFGSFLQNPIVLIAIGALMIGLALSMFGLYELQPPPWLLEKLGGSGTTSAAGVFFSGLVVGVFAAPCVGPPVVALLAVVGAKGDPWFGFTSFFTLAMGLGMPYLVLGTFSNLLQTLPRSGEWMVWVKKLFGVILVGVGAFYAMLAIAPALASWVIPVTLLVGGVYLGFVEKSANSRRGFRAMKWTLGVASLVLAGAYASQHLAAKLEFAPASDAAVEAALASGAPVMLEFSASWCVPCHELEDVTFTNRDVVAAARGFHAFGVDLTRYDSPEADAWRKRYGIAGVPTVVFLTRGGHEVRAARVEGFLPPARFIERMKLATAAAAEPQAAE